MSVAEMRIDRQTQFCGEEAGVFLDQQRIDHEAAIGNWPDRVLTDYLDDAVRSHPQSAALLAYSAEDQSETELSYADLKEKTDLIAGNLNRLGVRYGDVVSFQLPNWWQFIAVHLACLRIGAVSNPLMPIFRARELEFMVGFAGAKVLIVPRTFQKFDHQGLALDLKQKLPSLEHVFIVGGEDEHAFETALLGPQDRTDNHDMIDVGPNDVVQLLYTSGTTGEPKGVMHTSNTLLASVRQVSGRLGLGAGDVGFMPAPFAHQMGFCFGVMMSIVHGVPLVMMDAWDSAIAAGLIERHGVTYACASTPFLTDLANLPGIKDRNLDGFRIFMTSGAPIQQADIDLANDNLNLSIVAGWGMTEVIQATATQPLAGKVKVLTDGKAFPGNEVHIVSPNGRELASSEEGNLQCRGSTMFVGYFNRPELYDVNEEGWFDTGDLARMDGHGDIRVVGRSKDIIIRGGENIPVFEVEKLIYIMSQVCDVALVAMPDARLGERCCAFVTLNAGCDLSFEELVSCLEEENLARQYLPERLEILDDMPRTPSGKIQKFVLREMAVRFGDVA